MHLLVFYLLCIYHIFFTHAEFHVNVDVYPLEVTEGDFITVRCEVSNFYDNLPFSVSLLCPYVKTPYCFNRCDNICKDNNNCQYKDAFKDVICHQPEGDWLVYTYVFKNISTTLNNGKGFACKFKGKKSAYKQVYVKKRPPSIIYTPKPDPYQPTTKRPKVYTKSSSIETFESSRSPILSPSKKKKDSEALVYLVLAVIIILIISVVFTVFASIRCILIELFSTNQKRIPMKNLCCYTTEINVRRQYNGLSTNEYDTVPNEPIYSNNSTMSPHSMMTQMSTMSPMTPTSYRRQQSYPGYQYSLPSYNRNHLFTNVPPYTTQNSYDNHYPTYGGPTLPLQFVAPPGYDYNNPSDVNYNHRPNGHVPVSPPPVSSIPAVTRTAPLLPNTELQQSQTHISDSHTSFTDDCEGLPSVPGFVSRTASECFYNSYPDLQEQQHRVRSVEAIELSKLNAEMINQLGLNK